MLTGVGPWEEGNHPLHRGKQKDENYLSRMKASNELLRGGEDMACGLVTIVPHV